MRLTVNIHLVLMAKKILVTGADGFIGSHLVEKLVAEGYEVRAFVLYNSFGSWGWLDEASSEVKEAIEVVVGDVRDSTCVRKAMEGCNSVLHLAALIAIPYSYRAPQSYLDVNISGTLNVVQAARDLGVDKVVHTSTSEVYGTAQFVPITEKHPLVAQSPYAASKIGADQTALSFFRSFDTPVAVVRPFNTYGPRQSVRAVIPSIITQIAGGCDKVTMGSLHPTRDFSFVADTVAGMIAVLRSSNSVGRVINIGSGFEIAVGDLAHLITEVMGREIELTSVEERMRPDKSEVDRLVADNTLAQELLGWSPQFAGADGLRKGLVETAAWFSEPVNLARYRVGEYII
jgi:dTDP-glucose 4,6-dehydratase